MVLGGDVSWSLVGLLIDQLFDSAVMALHAAQGLRLGLPQMISSRVQFDVYGARIPVALVRLMYLGSTAVGTMFSSQAIGQFTGLSDSAGIFVLAALIVPAMVLGYRVIHIIGRIASVLGIIAFVYPFSRLMLLGDTGNLLTIRHSSWASFLLTVSSVASRQIVFGLYVVDYSRCLSASASLWETFPAIGLGSVLGAQVSMVLGMFSATLTNDRFAGREVAYIVGLGSNGTVTALPYFSTALDEVIISTLDSYGNFMCIATIISSVRGQLEIIHLQCLFLVLTIVDVSTFIALFDQHPFLAAFKSFILFLLTSFTLWSVANLVDYYFITCERYDTPALADPDGRYGRQSLLGIAIYTLGVPAQMPFLATALYIGPMVEHLGGVDISRIIGLLAPAVLHYLVAWHRITRQAPARVILPVNLSAFERPAHRV